MAVVSSDLFAMKNWPFYRLLHSRRDAKGRKMTTALLAELACGSAKKQSHVSRVLNGDHGRGTFTRRRLYPFLTLKEVRLLGWEADYNRWRRAIARRLRNSVVEVITPFGTLHVSAIDPVPRGTL